MLYWIDILHLYQPPTQSKEVIDKIVAESYGKILELLGKYPNLRLTVNISGSLLELLEKYGHQGTIDGFKKYADNGQVELMGSAMYHPILPLLLNKEVERQIDLNTKILKKHFKNAFKFQGFYLPEMAYSDKAARVIKKAGFDWIILDEIHTTQPVDPAIRYTIKKIGLGVLFRNPVFSRSFPPESIIVKKDTIKSDYLVTAHDAELYGHWHKDDQGYYQKVFSDSNISTLTASDYLSKLDKKEDIILRPANWESTPEELAANIPYGLWANPANEIHKKLERLKDFALKTIEKNRENNNYRQARMRADKGIASCAWWWATERKLGPFSPITWNPEEVEKGAQELLSAVRSLKKINEVDYLTAEKLFNKVHAAVWKLHWKKHPEGQ